MKRLLVLTSIAALALSACGSDESSSSAPETVSTEAPEPARSGDADGDESESETVTTGRESGESDSADADADSNARFPVTIEHKFGETTVGAEPERVVSIGFNEHDFLLALGVTPVGLRDWYGEQPNGVWPWAQDELGDAEPTVLAPDAINFEQIAALDPDLIVGVWSGMTERDYALLADIAPTVAQSDEFDDFGTPWQEQTLRLGQATGTLDRAEQVVADLDARFEEVAAAHPEWAGLEASAAFFVADGPGAYTSQDTRSRVLADLGFSIPDVNDSGAEGSFFLQLTAEDISALDVDVLVWTYSSDEELDGILDRLPTRPSLDAAIEGREVFADPELTGAFSHGSPLSLDFALDALIPELEAAADGDPATAVPSAVEVGAVDGAQTDTGAAGDGSADSGEATPDEEAVAAFAAVFDSTVPFDEKSTNLENADALAETVKAYAAAGDGFVGISLVPSRVEVDGDTAEITYDVNFGENPAYSDQGGTIALVDGVWIVSEDEFCSFMASARVSC